MDVTTTGIPSEATRLTLRLLEELWQSEGADKVGVRLWDDTRWPDEDRPTTLVLRHPGAPRAMFLPGTELGLAEAFIYDDLDIEGEIESAFDLADAITDATSGWRKKLRIARDLLKYPAQGARRSAKRGPAKLKGRRHSVQRDRQAVRYHYDVSNDFYALWLDPRMVYSCAYFPTGVESLDMAQEHKLDYICHKLRLKPGQRLLDIGCGWGGLVIHASERYGVDATGITLSQPQAEMANQRIAAAGLSDRCRVLVQDYREVGTTQGFDALVSVGMFEHIGAALLPTYFELAWKLLREGGVFLNHGIACKAGLPAQREPTFSDTYVFPDGELVPIHVTLRAAEESGFEVRDVESLREHYAMTLRHWVRRLEAQHESALRYVDEPTYRVWRLFMSGSAHGFTRGRLNVYQALVSRPDDQGHSRLPLNREDWYQTA